MRRFQVFLCSILLLAALLAGCSVNSNSEGEGKTPPAGQDISQDSRTVYPLTMVDDIGASVTLTAKPTRIVSLLPSTTEILAEVGQEPIAVTKWDDYPAGIQERAEYIFQDALNPNLEQIISLKPDLIMYWLASGEDTRKIKSLGIPVMVFEPKNIAEVYETIAEIGQIVDKQERASNVIKEMKAKEKAIEDKLKELSEDQKRKVWMEVDSNLYTAGSGTFLDEILTKAGGINIASDIQGWAQFNSEQVIARNPDVIFETYSYSDKNVIESIKGRKGWGNVEAVKNDRVISVDNNIISRQGPRVIDGLKLIAEAIYPELFE